MPQVPAQISAQGHQEQVGADENRLGEQEDDSSEWFPGCERSVALAKIDEEYGL